MNPKKMYAVIFVVLLTAILSIFGCSSTSSDTAVTVSALAAKTSGDLTAGLPCEVELEMLANGALYAVTIEPAEGHGHHHKGDGEHHDCDDTDDNDGGVVEDGDGGVAEHHDMGFSTQVDAVAADCSSFTVFGGLAVAQGEIESDDDDALAICDLTVGMWVKVEGEYGVDGVFTAREIEAEDDAVIEIESVIENLTDSAFTMIGLTIAYDANTVFVTDDGDEHGDGDGDGDSDGDGHGDGH